MPGEERPLLPTISPQASAALREVLGELRRQATDPAVRDSLDDVLAGRRSLRDVARTREFLEFAGPLAERGMKEFEERRDEVAELARRYEAGPDGTRPDASGTGRPRQ